MPRRIHVDQGLGLTRVVGSVVGPDHDLEAWMVREKLGLARGLHDVLVTRQHPEGIIRPLVKEDRGVAAQAIPGLEGIAVARIEIRIDQLGPCQGRSRIEFHYSRSFTREARTGVTAANMHRAMSSARSVSIAVPICS